MNQLILNKVKTILSASGTTFYDTKLEIFVSAALNDLKDMGVEITEENITDENFFNSVCLCIFYPCLAELDPDQDTDKLMNIFLAKAHSLRQGQLA